MKRAVTVGQATFADLEALTELFDRYRQFQGQRGDARAVRAFLRARFDHGESVTFIARVEAQAVGLAQLYPSYSSVALKRVYVLNDLFVDAAATGCGVKSLSASAAKGEADIGAAFFASNAKRSSSMAARRLA